jgi:hypothetical protein
MVALWSDVRQPDACSNALHGLEASVIVASDHSNAKLKLYN